MQERFAQSVGPARYSDIGLLKDHPYYSARKFAEIVGITPKAIEKHLAKLVSKHSPSCYGILLAELTDTSSFHIQWLDLIFRTNVASHVLQAAEEDSLLFTEEQRLHLDSTVLFGSGLNHLDRLCEGDSNLLPALAEYKNPEDIPLIIEFFHVRIGIFS